MGAFTYIETDTGSNANIASATAVGAYTATGDKLIMVDVSIDQVAGNGDYVMYVTRQIGGSGSAYRILPQTTMAAASGLTAISAQSGWITVRNGDVLTCYVDGLAGDTSAPDWTTRWFEDSGTAGVAVASIATDAITAAALKADAVTEIVTGVWGADLSGYGGGEAGSDLLYYQYQTYHDLADGGRLDLLIDSIITHLTQIKGTGWTNQTLAKIVTDIAAISAGSGAIAQEVWEYATRVLTAGTNIDLSALATAADLATLDGKVDTVDGILDDLHDTDIPAIKTETAAIKAKTDLIPASPAEAGEYTAAIAAVKSVADDILVDTGTTLDALVKDIPTNAELATALGTADDAVLAAVAAAKVVIDDIHNTDLPAIKAETAAIKAKTDNLPATPASAGEYTAAIAALQADLDNPNQYKADVSGLATNTDITDLKERIYAVDTIADAILEDTGTTIPATLATIAGYADGIAGDVWSYKVRTLTNSLTSTTEPASGDPISLYRYATNNISFSDLGVMTGRTKLWITFKENNDQADALAIMQVEETAGLVVLNGSATLPAGITTAEVSITVDDASTGSITIRIDQLVANVLSTYEAYPIYFDIKQLISDDVNLLYQGEAYIYATSTQTIS